MNENRFIEIGSLLSCFITVIVFAVFYCTELYRNTGLIKGLMMAGLLGCIAVAVISFLKGNRSGAAGDIKRFITAITVMGVIIRIGYMLYTPYSVRGHDIGLYEGGHADYILSLMGGSLPDSNVYQLYHPPLFHFLAAAASNLFRAFTGEQDINKLLEAGKIISCWASILTLFMTRELGREVGLGKPGTITMMCVAAFLPEHYLLAGRLNNDSLCVFFMTAIILLTLRWYRTRSFIRLIALALCFGLGMMTKISVGVFALVTGTIMVIVLIRSIRNGNGRECFLKYLVFAVIAFPLGFWYPIRNLIRFAQPLNYVSQIDIADPLYCGDHSLISRFLPLADNFLYADPSRDYNVWSYVLRTSVFGEFSYDIPSWIPQALLICAGILAITGLIVMIIVNLQNPSFEYRVLTAFWIVLIVSFQWFNVKYPFGCTMDFRYIVPTALIGSVFLGRWADVRKTGIVVEIAGYMLWILLGLFCITSCLMYTMI